MFLETLPCIRRKFFRRCFRRKIKCAIKCHSLTNYDIEYYNFLSKQTMFLDMVFCKQNSFYNFSFFYIKNTFCFSRKCYDYYFPLPGNACGILINPNRMLLIRKGENHWPYQYHKDWCWFLGYKGDLQRWCNNIIVN